MSEKIGKCLEWLFVPLAYVTIIGLFWGMDLRIVATIFATAIFLLFVGMILTNDI